jgi:glycosyltransferase involved in cell wall biosynthesis
MNTPEISVVMATKNPAEQIYACLDSLRDQDPSVSAEVIVADASSDGSEQVIRARYPEVCVLHFEPSMEAPQLIREAFRRARGQIIAVTDAYCRFPPEWLARLRKAHETDYAVIGGAVENRDSQGLLNWACFFADYGAFMLPASRRVTSVLAGNHVSYKKWLIELKADSMREGFWKVFFHQDLQHEGMRFLFDPSLVAYCTHRDTFRNFSRRYFRNARLFAARRCKRITTTNRFLRLAATPVLPAVLLYRRLQGGLGKRGHRGRLLLCLPLLALFVTVWAVGEAAGYLRGPGKLLTEPGL